EFLIPVELAAVRVLDAGELLPVELGTEDLRIRGSLIIQLRATQGPAGVGAVLGFYEAQAGEGIPAQPALRFGLASDVFCIPVGNQGLVGNVRLRHLTTRPAGQLVRGAPRLMDINGRRGCCGGWRNVVRNGKAVGLDR